MKKTLMSVVAMLLLSGCIVQSDLQEEKISNVVKVFYHDLDEFSLMHQTPGSPDIKIRKFRCPDTSILADVPAGSNMWATAYYLVGETVGGKFPRKLAIHIRSAQDTGGGDWNHGKAGQGTTQAVE
jgi:hypothetical protein